MAHVETSCLKQTKLRFSIPYSKEEPANFEFCFTKQLYFMRPWKKRKKNIILEKNKQNIKNMIVMKHRAVSNQGQNLFIDRNK